MSYLNSVTIIGFVGADPEQREASSNGSKFTVLFVATTIKKGSLVLVEGTLVSSTYERPNGKSKKAASTKITSWCIRADAVRKLDRGEPEPDALTSDSNASDHTPEAWG